MDQSIDNASVFIQTNILDTYNVFEASRKSRIKTIIHVPTDEVYVSLPEGSADENYPLLPNSTYAASKSASELLARSYFVTHGLDVRTIHCFNNYSKYQFPEKVTPVFIHKIVSEQNLPIYGDVSNIREWIHVADHSFGIQFALENGTSGGIYNIGSGIHLSNSELVRQIIRILGCENQKKVCPRS